MYWEGDHVRLLLTSKDGKGISKELVREVSSVLTGIGCQCVLEFISQVNYDESL